jgi:diacylglycerol kinase family enzyme
MRGRAGESHTAWASPPQCDKEDTRDSIPQRRTTQLDDPSAVRQAGMRRVFATLSLVLCASAVGIVVVDAVTAFPRGLLIGSALVAATVVAWAGLRRRGTARGALLALGAALFVAAVILGFVSGLVLDALVPAVCLVAGMALSGRVFSVRTELPAAPRPEHPVVIWNPWSGGGKALKAGLAQAARARGIEPIELTPGADIVQLARDAIAAGADAIAAAGGDGTQALIASIAAEHDLPFACIPAGTRNHFALDLGVDRDDVVGALDALVSGGERVVDLAEVNGRTFVNNVSLGLYAEAVQREGYRDAKLRTLLDTIPDVLGTDPSQTVVLRWTSPDGVANDAAAVILVSNNAYRLGRALASGTRPTLDAGELGIAVGAPGAGGGTHRRWRQWSAPVFEVESTAPVPAGVDGEALVLEPPLRFSVHAAALRVRIATHHPGASPAAGLPDGPLDGVRKLAMVALGRL